MYNLQFPCVSPQKSDHRLQHTIVLPTPSLFVVFENPRRQCVYSLETTYRHTGFHIRTKPWLRYEGAMHMHMHTSR